MIDEAIIFCYITLMHGGQNMFRRLRNSINSGNQQESGRTNDSQSLLIHSLMDRVLKQGDTIAEMETTLVGIKNSLDAFKSVIQKVETNTSLSIPNLLRPIQNQVDQIPALKKEILELQNKVEILQTSLEQYKIYQYERMTNDRGKSTCKSWQTCLFFSSKIH
jgi:septation ring formation regulator EzrA